MRIPAHFTAAACAAVLACGVGAQPARTPQQAAEAAAPRILLQVCLPGRKAVAEEVVVDITDMPADTTYMQWDDILTRVGVTGEHPRTEGGTRERTAVRSARPVEGTDAAPPHLIITQVQGGVVASASSGAEKLADTTAPGQPVYTLFTHRKPGEMLAVYVTLLGRDASARTNFWFRPPQAIPVGDFTAWMPPDTQEAPQPGHHGVLSRLFTGKGLPVAAIDPDAPRMRFMLRSLDEQDRQTKPRTRAAWIRRVGEMAGFDPVVEGPRVVPGASPDCSLRRP